MGCGTSGLKDCNKSGQSVNNTNVNTTKIDNVEQHDVPPNQIVPSPVDGMNSMLNDNQQNELKEPDNDNTPSISVTIEESTSVHESHHDDNDDEKQPNTLNSHELNTIN
uniref:SJCHGC02587 protein n=1 Tax=Schistosoma japonicum TaxID=6182 RepID=Q5D9Y4_SCHJA|nr:SJCHGC02587 protein [Schistosoma japonicum]